MLTKKRVTRKSNYKLQLRAFKKGDLVQRMTSNAMKNYDKFFANWKGPFRVAEDAGKGSYRLECLSGQPISYTWNVTHLKFYFS